MKHERAKEIIRGMTDDELIDISMTCSDRGVAMRAEIELARRYPSRRAITDAIRSAGLDALIERARHHVMTPAEEEEQVRSFAYGNVKMHNPAITREDVDREADKLLADAAAKERP